MRKINIFLVRFLLAFFFILTGCGKDTSPPFIPSAEPTPWQIKNSRFWRFTVELAASNIDMRKELFRQFLSEHPIAPIVEGDSLICFFWFGKSSTVLINSDLHAGWTNPDTMNVISCGDESFFFKIFSVPPDARFDYLFIIDNKETTDPLNKRTAPSGYGLHSEAMMPCFKPDTVRAFRTDVPQGSIDSILFESSDKEIIPHPFKVYKPAGYDTLSSLPSLYVTDGFKALEFMSFSSVLNNLIADKIIEPVIVVFLSYENNDGGFFLEKNAQLTKAICNELVPQIDKTYRTNANPHYRAISGISAGGHFSLISAFNRPDVFLNAAGQSSTLTEKLFDEIRNASKNKKSFDEYRIYFDVGVFDLTNGTIDNHTFLTANRKLNSEVKKLGFNFRYSELNDGHQWANWRERIDDILIYFFGAKQ